MSALRAYSPPSPQPHAAVFDALADVMATAATYADAAARFSAIHDAKGAAYAVRSASACLLTAAELMDELRPSISGRKA
ncbi:hypothetical protein [Methylobacterium sp.]|uniref:hypothetical protein n=1 Tax=Methylobacterium sp. TaxID=409 RepID=UPI0025FC9CB5|nr:hypothetical protein [Methylobacterium sp.]MBY0260434.1 hypothetical protein [Methylobacterium sp.]